MRADRTREISQIDQHLYEYLLPEEERPGEDHVVTHVVIKADIRGSTKMTQKLFARGLNPASHISLNLRRAGAASSRTLRRGQSVRRGRRDHDGDL